MTSLEYSQMSDKFEQIRNESRGFIYECRKHIQNSKILTDHTSQQMEELMILKEESIANKCESIAILRLANQRSENLKLVFESGNIERGIADDTRIALEMLNEIRQALIPDKNSTLLALRSPFFGLSFLPK